MKNRSFWENSKKNFFGGVRGGVRSRGGVLGGVSGRGDGFGGSGWM